eukprot:3970522-Pleurochrysis_carterae.AAC.1
MRVCGSGVWERQVVSCVTSGKVVWLLRTATFMAIACLASACVSQWFTLGARVTCVTSGKAVWLSRSHGNSAPTTCRLGMLSRSAAGRIY